jgi:hypothetical protein
VEETARTRSNAKKEGISNEHCRRPGNFKHEDYAWLVYSKSSRAQWISCASCWSQSGTFGLVKSKNSRWRLLLVCSDSKTRAADAAEMKPQ